MFRIIAYTVISFFIFSCRNDLKQQDPVVIINSEKYFLKQIDSIGKESLYKVRSETIDQLITRRLLNLEAKQREISLDSLLNSLFELKDVDQPLEIINNSLSEITKQKIINRKYILDSLIYVLKNKYPVYTFLQPTAYNTEMIKKIASNVVGNENAKDEIIIFFDFDCYNCIRADSVIHKIYLNNKDKMKFRFVYYSDYIDKTVLACDAAAKQGKYMQMHDMLIKNTLERNDSLMIYFASSLGLNVSEFVRDYHDDSNIKKHLRNKQILNEIGIYSVPCFVVNGRFIADLPTFKYVISELN